MRQTRRKGFFITGTDTGVGKTTFSVALIERLISHGKKVSVLKPVASGCEKINLIWKNNDALKLMKAANTSNNYQQVNPYAFKEAIAPHLAAKKNNIQLETKTIFQRCKTVLESPTDYCIVEGAGGWLVPLNQTETFADLAKCINLPVIMVVSIKLGCINHALLTAVAIQQSQLNLFGWVANVIDNTMDSIRENIETIQQSISAPLIAEMHPMNEEIKCEWKEPSL